MFYSIRLLLEWDKLCRIHHFTFLLKLFNRSNLPNKLLHMDRVNLYVMQYVHYSIRLLCCGRLLLEWNRLCTFDDNDNNTTPNNHNILYTYHYKRSLCCSTWMFLGWFSV